MSCKGLVIRRTKHMCVTVETNDCDGFITSRRTYDARSPASPRTPIIIGVIGQNDAVFIRNHKWNWRAHRGLRHALEWQEHDPSDRLRTCCNPTLVNVVPRGLELLTQLLPTLTHPSKPEAGL